MERDAISHMAPLRNGIAFLGETAAQDMLEATGYNYELTAEILGWISIDMLKKYYGRIGEDTIDKGFAQAVGMQVVWKRREFKF